MAWRTDQAANEVGVAQGRVKRCSGRKVAQPAGRDGRLAPDRRIAIGQERQKSTPRLPVAANAHRPRGLETQPRRRIGQHRADCPTGVAAADRVKSPERVQPPRFG